MKRRYQIHFGAKFDHTVEAENAEHAKLIADELAASPLIAINGGARDLHCAWITITPLGETNAAR